MSRGNRWLDDDIEPVRKGTSRWQDDDDVEDFDPNKDYFTQVVQRKEYNMVESTQRSLRMLDESERVGVSTAEELVRQGEVLRKTEQRVDKMEQDLKESDRHLRSIKSIWGAFVNKFSKEPPPSKPISYDDKADKNGAQPKLKDAIDGCDRAEEHRRDASEHPVLQRQQQSKQLYTEQEKAKSSGMQEVEENLGLMGQSLSRLKQLGLGMQAEIDSQDPVIERLGGKINNVDSKIHRTNKEMIKINRS
ncbi:synaptosomal-associated protein 29-like [Clavelina lepadiformis]|uniref:synaptosomal-associated protein 29-like n=1 Tax=Clavelina lepadiformis TaxID=159417 RepID=UPI0040423908